MVCAFCKEPILDDAVKCKHCNSVLGQPNYTDYSQVPWFRKNWFAILCAFIFSPALLFLVITGDIYYKRKGHIKKYGIVAKIILGILGALAFLKLLILLTF